ncbi:MAG: lipopolysaccharide heptosyltransferase family protein [Candidatus Methylopumilus sp.]|nr:lipopolysaccharide heptosyltransferase family protein [Candidatus Methylopumilus sp.]
MSLKNTLKAFFLKIIARKKNTPFDNKKLKKILIFRYDRIGDMIVTTPLISALKKSFPKSRVIILASEVNAGVLTKNRYVDKIQKYPKNIFLAILCLTNLRKEKIDLLIDLNHSIVWRALLEIRLINPVWAISPQKGSRYGVNGSSLGLYDKQGDADVNQPLSLVYLNLINLLKPKLRDFNNNYYVPLDKKHLKRTSRILNRKNKPYICLNFFGSKEERNLDFNSINLIVKTIKNECSSCTIFLITSPSNYLDNIKIKNSLLNHNLVEVLPPAASILYVASLIKSMDLLITPDTSLVHFACAYKIRLIAIYPQNEFNYMHWQPIGYNKSLVLFSKHPKSLEGYSERDLLKNIIYMLKNLNKKSAYK